MSELLAYMDETRRRLVDTATQIAPAFASVRPRSGAWSAAENLAHLAKVEEGVARMMERSVEWARSHGVGPSTSDDSVMASLDEFRLTEPVRKLIAPESVAPEDDVPPEKSLESLASSRKRLVDAINAGSDLDLTSVKRPHRIMGELDMYQWALFVAQHEERHRRQIERTMEEVTELAAECAPIV
jgi:hypothetical protein